MSRFKNQDYYGIEAITPNDSTDLSAREYRGLIVRVDGDVVVTNSAGDDVTLTLVAGVEYHFTFHKVKATGTTATGIVGLL